MILWGSSWGYSGCSFGTPLPWGPEILKRQRCTGHTALDTVWYDRDCANARAGGCKGGAAPPELSTHFNAALHCKDHAAISEMVEQEQWGAEGVQPPLNHSHYIRYNFNAGCSAGSAPFFVICRITPYLSWCVMYKSMHIRF